MLESKILDQSDISQLFNIKNPAYVADPYIFYSKVRETKPVCRTPYGVYVITRHADIVSFLDSNNLTKNYWKPIENIYGKSAHDEAGFALISRWLTNLNPPHHTHLRRLLAKVMSLKELGNLEEIVSSVANHLIDQFIDRRSADLVHEYTFKLPAMMICKLLNIPDEDFDFIFKHVNLPNVLLDPVYHSRETLNRANESVDLLVNYFSRLCRQREACLGTDLISLLIIAKKEQNIEISDIEFVSNIFFLFGAGWETTMNLISNSLITFFHYREVLEALRNDFSLIPQAIEEVLRYQSPIQVASPSQTTEEITIGDATIPAGEIVIPIIASGNRDPRQFKDPDKFDIMRNPKRVLSFGSGIHLCLGAHLARIETKAAVQCLLERLPELNILDIAHPKWRPHVGLRGPSELLAVW